MSDEREIDPDAARAHLLARREELERLTEAGAAARRPVELDQTRVGRPSRMDALQDQAMSVETERRRQVELRRIEAAFARIAEGEYGYCANCGEAIGAKRLESDPTAPLCIECAARGGG